MDKFLIFVDAADDACMFPLSRLQSINCTGNAAIQFTFSPGSLGDGQAASIDKVVLTITADTEVAVMKALAKKITEIGDFSSDPYLVVCDDVNSVFAHGDILSCVSTIDA